LRSNQWGRPLDSIVLGVLKRSLPKKASEKKKKEKVGEEKIEVRVFKAPVIGNKYGRGLHERLAARPGKKRLYPGGFSESRPKPFGKNRKRRKTSQGKKLERQ